MILALNGSLHKGIMLIIIEDIERELGAVTSELTVVDSWHLARSLLGNFKCQKRFSN